MPPELKARVKAAAEQNNRSMNAEIVATLEEKYPNIAVKNIEILRRFLDYAIEEQIEMVESLRNSGVNPSLIKLLNAFVEAQRNAGERLPSDNLDEVLKRLGK